MLTIPDLMRIFVEYDDTLFSTLSLDQIMLFYDLTKCLLPRIALTQSVYKSTAPESLERNVHEFLVSATELSSNQVKLCWIAL
jgi:hypothetical protein